MRKKNKNKDSGENKRKLTSSKFFSNLNTNNNIEYGYAETNVKSKRFKWIFSSLVLGVLVTGIAVPWSLSSCTAQLKKPIPNSSIVWTYTDPLTGEIKEQSMTMKEWIEKVKNMKFDNSFIKKWTNAFNATVIENLYNEEREAFLKFKAEYQATHNGEWKTTFGADLSKSVNNIKNEQRKILEDNKKRFQKTMGNQWLEQWLKELQTNSLYGPQNADENATTNDISRIENDAVEYMKVQSIKEPALARFRSASIDTNNWTSSDLNVTNLKEITYLNNKGEKQIIPPNTVNFKNYLTPLNTALPKNVTADNQNLIAVFETKSYVPKYRVPNQMMSKVLTNIYKSATISSFELGLVPVQESSSDFEFTSNVIKKLFSVSNIQSLSTIDNFVAINQISSFQGASNSNKVGTEAFDLMQTKDEALIKAIKDEADASEATKTLGSSKLKTLGEFFASSSASTQDDSSSSSASTEVSFNLAALGADGAKYTSTVPNQSQYQLFRPKEINPFSIFLELLFSIPSAGNVKPTFTSYQWIGQNWETIVGNVSVSAKLWNLIDLLKQNFTLEGQNGNKTIKFTGTNNVGFNEELKIRADALEKSDNQYLGNLFRAILTDENAQTTNVNTYSPIQKLGYWTLYKLSATTYMYVEASKIKIFSVSINTNELNNFDNMIASDLYKTVNAPKSSDSSSPTSPSLLYDVASFYSKVNNEFFISKILLSSPTMSDQFKFGISQELNYEIKYNNNIVSSYEELPENWFTTLLSSDQQNEINRIFAQFNEQINVKVASTIATNNQGAYTDIETKITEIANNKKTYDLAEYQDSSGNITTIFQSSTQYGQNAIYKNINDIQLAFLNTLKNIININVPTQAKGGK